MKAMLGLKVKLNNLIDFRRQNLIKENFQIYINRVDDGSI